MKPHRFLSRPLVVVWSALAVAVAIGAVTTGLPLAQAESAKQKLPQELLAVYQVSTAGTVVGEYSMRLQRSGDHYDVESSVTPKGLATIFAPGPMEQTSQFGIKRGRVLPLQYNERRSGKTPPEYSLAFDWDNMTVTLPDGSQLPIPRQPVDPAALPVQVMLTPPAPDRDLVVNLVNDRGVRTHTVSLLGDADMETSLGQVKAQHLRQRKKGAKEGDYIDIWIDPDQYNVPIRIERHKRSRMLAFALLSVETK